MALVLPMIYLNPNQPSCRTFPSFASLCSGHLSMHHRQVFCCSSSCVVFYLFNTSLCIHTQKSPLQVFRMQRGNSSSNGSAGVHQACASCKHQRKKCGEDCILAPFFPADKSKEFQAVHKVFGVANVTKLVRGVKQEDRKFVADSLVWEAFCRQNDPILGPLGEYRKIQEELNLYKIKNQVLNDNPMVQAGRIPYKPASAVISWNGINGINSKGDGIGGGLAKVGYSPDNGIVDSNPYSCPLHFMQSTEKLKQEKEVGSLLVPLQPQQAHSVNGFNQQFYIPGQFGSMNGKTMDASMWEDKP